MMVNLFTWNDQTWQMIDRAGILLGVAMGITWFAGLIWALPKPDTLRRWFIRNRFPSIGGRPEHTRCQGLIFTFSHVADTIYVSTEYKDTKIDMSTANIMAISQAGSQS